MFCTPTLLAYENVKQIWSEIFLDTFCSLLSSQKFAQFLVFSGTCKSCDLLLPYCQFLYCTLCSLSTEFSGSSKQGLYFPCKVQAFNLLLEPCWNYFHIIFLLQIKWNRKEMKILSLFFWGGGGEVKFKTFLKMYFYLYLSVNRSAVTLLCPNLSPSVCGCVSVHVSVCTVCMGLSFCSDLGLWV